MKGSSSDDARYRFERVTRVRLSPDSSVVVTRAGASPRTLPSDVARALEASVGLRTLDEHAARASAATGRPELAPQIRATLGELAADGDLVCAEDIVAAHASDTHREGATIRCVAFITRDRVASLRRAVSSFAENTKRHGVACAMVVMDDSPAAATREECRAMLRVLSREHGISIAYAGLDEKKRYVDELVAESGVAAHVARFAVFDTEGCGFLAGGNRNAALLHCAGEAFLCTDDDTEARVAAPVGSQASDDVAFVPMANVHFSFFDDREAALAAVDVLDESLLGLHERLLGKDFATLARDVGDPRRLVLDDATPETLHDLRTGRGRIVATMTGIYGDCAMDAPDPLLFAPSPTRERVLANEATFARAMTSREILRIVPRVTIAPAHPSFVATSVALDGRAILPPFMPVLRGEDWLFAHVLCLSCEHERYAACMPRAILHAAEGRGTYAARDKGARGISFDALVALCMDPSQLVPGAGDGASRMRMLGRDLANLASAARDDFDDVVRVRHLASEQQRARYLANALQQSRGQPPYFMREVKEQLSILQAQATDDAARVPFDLRDGRSDDDARALAQRLVGLYGELLDGWDAMMQAARRLRARGVRVAEPV